MVTEKKRVQVSQQDFFKDMRIIATALQKLYKKLGEEVPENLAAVVERLNRGIQTAPVGIPVSSLVDPKTIPIVSRNGR